MKCSFQNPPQQPEGFGAVAGGGSGFLLRRSIAFTRVSSRTPGDGSFLGRKQLGQRRRLTYLPQGNHEPEGVAQKPDSEKPQNPQLLFPVEATLQVGKSDPLPAWGRKGPGLPSCHIPQSLTRQGDAPLTSNLAICLSYKPG